MLFSVLPKVFLFWFFFLKFSQFLLPLEVSEILVSVFILFTYNMVMSILLHQPKQIPWSWKK